MNNERYNQIIEEVGQKYTKWWYDNAIPSSNGKPKLDGEDILTRSEFINRIKTDSEFSERWGLKIEERELSLEERRFLLKKSKVILPLRKLDEEFSLDNFFKPYGIPTKLITITYNNETIESYE